MLPKSVASLIAKTNIDLVKFGMAGLRMLWEITRAGATVVMASAVLSASAAWAQTGSEALKDTMGARVLACAPCHGAAGEGTHDPYFPRLAGKPSGYLYNQLLAFRNGRRHYPPMNYLLEFLPPDYLQKMADYFAAQRPPLPASGLPDVSKEILASGQALVTRGDYAREIPACTSCHGLSLTGQEPAIPGLLGLRASYISAQLGAWRYGTRTALAPDCMQVVAGHLSEDDVKAVAAYLASRPAPENSSPMPKGSFALPFACGSQQE
jgi:cytochrome c553